MSYVSAVREKDSVIIWDRIDGIRDINVYRAPYYFYTHSISGEYKSMFGDTLTKHEFSNSREFNAARLENESLHREMFESDIPPELKLLSERYHDVNSPILHVSFFDIEVDYDITRGFSSINDPYAPINSIALYNNWQNCMIVLAVAPKEYTGTLQENKFIEELEKVSPLPTDVKLNVRFFKNEKDLLLAFLEEIDDADAISGWNSEFFDVPYVGKRLELIGKRYFNQLSFARAKKPKWREVSRMGQEVTVLDLSGRASLDYLELFKKYEMYERPSYKLESIADEMLPDLPKLEYEGSLATLYRKDFVWFVRYNIRDTEILKGFEDTLGYVELANQMVHISSGLFQHVLGTLKLAELATINYCHHKLDNLIVKDLNVPEEDGQIQGAFVLIPQVGVHDMIGSVDITSLYPSSIRSINISPEKLIGQFTAKNDACIAIRNKSAATLRLEFDNGDVLEKTGDEWNTILWDRKLAVSGYGTVFLQDEKGIIPIILEDWFNTRKELQKKKAKAKEDGDKIKATYYDKMQYVYKIKLNSFYGALTNKYFRFFDLRMGESTTSTGRAILLHQCASCCEVLDQKYQPTDVSVYDEKTGKTHVGYSDKWSVVYGDSVSGDTIIETDTGPTPIEQLFQTQYYTCGEREYSNCNNTQTLTYDPSTGHNTFKSVKYVMRHQVNKQMYRVWFGNTNYLDVTEDHSLIGYANSKHNTPGLIEIKPTDIGKNNVNSLILSAELPHTVSISPMNLSKEMYQLIGFIIGDGHVEVKKESGVGLSIGKQDKQEIINTLINPLIEQGWFTSTVHMKNGHDVRLCGVKGWKKLREWLYPNNTKQFPLWVEQETSTNIAHILTGYFSADGFANKNKTIGLCSINPDFIKQTNRLLHMCNIPSNFWTETTENSFNGVYSGTYTIRLTVYDGVKFGNDIGFLQDRKNKNIPTLYSKNKYHRRQHPGFCLIRPTKIEPLHIQPTYVYDIEVEHTHMFYANNILVHNTDSTYFETHTDTTEDAIVIADYVGELVNKTFPKFMRDMFLCQPGFDNIIKTGREIVSDRGIFVKKKRYILHIINDDGYPVDKIKVMGLDTKKTTLPKTVSKKLNGFIERYLKRENWDTVALDIIDYKEELINSPNIMDIGLPKGVKGVELYTTAWKQDSKTRLPGHVAASILYNLSRDEYNDKINPPIVSGMKIKVFYLLQQHGRFRSIAIPGDIEEIPSWFLENFQIDKDAQLQRLVNKPLGNILEAVNLIVPSNQSLLNDSLLEY